MGNGKEIIKETRYSNIPSEGDTRRKEAGLPAEISNLIQEIHAIVVTAKGAKKSEHGLLGSIWGDGKGAPAAIVGLITILLTFAGIAILFIPNPNMPAAEYWKTAGYLISLAFGYLLGKIRA